MENKCVIAIDYGTQSVRVSIIDDHGKFLAFEQERYNKPYFSPKPGYCEQDPNFYYDNMCKAAKRLAEKHPDLMRKAVSISSTCFRDTAVYLDKDFNIVRPSIIWLDQRQADLKRKLPWWQSVAFWFVNMTKTVNLNRKRTPAIWLQENEPENWAKIKHYVPLNVYFNYRMLGVLKDSASNMIGHYPLNFRKGKWYKKGALKGELYNIDPDLMPEIAPVGTVIGKITKECSLETGFPEGLQYITTGNDKSCEALGSGQVDSDSAHISYGTSSSIAVISQDYFEPEKFLPSYIASFPGWYSGEVQIYRGYWMLTWFVQQFGQNESIEAQIEKVAPEELLNEKLMDIPPGSDGLILQPYWGPGLSRPLAKGAVIGFFDVHTKFHFYRAIIEGIGFALKEGLDSIEKRSHKKVKYLTIAGGGSRSDAICQITADLFDLPVYKSETFENSSLGCACAQFLALKRYNSLNDVKKNMIRYVKVFTPNKKDVKEYKELYEKVYVKVYPSLLNIYKELTDIDIKNTKKSEK